jgi:hypothetical protein
MSTDEKMVKALEALQEGQKDLRAGLDSIKDVQQKQGEQLEKQGKQIDALQADVKILNGKVDTVVRGGRCLKKPSDTVGEPKDIGLYCPKKKF